MGFPATTDCLIIGAGPAGLAAAAGCESSRASFLLVEAGVPLAQRDRESPDLLTEGVGGAGLFSDGKFSFFPSASQLWVLRDKDALSAAYRWFCDLISSFGVSTPGFPNNFASIGVEKMDGFERKCYTSVYMPLEQRMSLMRLLADKLRSRLLTGAEVSRCTFDAGYWTCTFITSDGRECHLKCRSIIFCAGRFGPLVFKQVFPQGRTEFRRVEVGVRIEQPTDSFFLESDPQIDPKLKVAGGPNVELRTFCCCRAGEVVATRTRGIWSVSGRADGPRTTSSNVGVNIRILDPAIATEVWSQVAPSLGSRETSIVRESVSTFLAVSRPMDAPSRIGRLLGTVMSDALAHGLKVLGRTYPSLRSSDAIIWAPTIEGVGAYPSINMDLQADALRLWVAGDSSGIFRGLTAAIVSGYYSGLQASALGGS